MKEIVFNDAKQKERTLIMAFSSSSVDRLSLVVSQIALLQRGNMHQGLGPASFSVLPWHHLSRADQPFPGSLACSSVLVPENHHPRFVLKMANTTTITLQAITPSFILPQACKVICGELESYHFPN